MLVSIYLVMQKHSCIKLDLERGALIKNHGNLHIRLVLGDCKRSRSPHPPASISKLYVEALSGLSRICQPDGLKTLEYIRAVSLGQLSGGWEQGEGSF